MDLARPLSVTILACLLLLAGCFKSDETDDAIDDAEGASVYVLIAVDHSDDVEDHVGLMTLTFENGSDLVWSLVEIEIFNGTLMPITCSNPGSTGANCEAQYSGSDSGYWEKGETVTLTDSGANFCDADCNMTARIKYDGDVIMGRTLHLV